MSAKYRFRRLRNRLEHRSYKRPWYYFRDNWKFYISYEKFNQSRIVKFIAKRLWLVQIWSPIFLQTQYEWEIWLNLVWLYIWKELWEEYWIERIWKKKSEIIEQQKEMEYRELMRENQRRIDAIHTIFYKKW